MHLDFGDGEKVLYQLSYNNLLSCSKWLLVAYYAVAMMQVWDFPCDQK